MTATISPPSLTRDMATQKKYGGGLPHGTKKGFFFFDEQTDRYDIRFDIADYYGGLHCGECFDVFTGGKWKPTRIEMSAAQEWYLVGIRAEDLNGLRVRI